MPFSSSDSATPKPLNTDKLLHDLGRINRAYNLMYALGSQEGTFDLTLDEVDALIQAAHETSMGLRTTELHREIASKVNPTMLRYVAIGYMGRAQ